MSNCLNLNEYICIVLNTHDFVYIVNNYIELRNDYYMTRQT